MLGKGEVLRTNKKAGEATGNPRGGRPRKEISPDQLEQLAAIQCTDLEICAVLGISHDTLMRRKREPEYQRALEEGRAKGRASLRRAQWKAATSGNTSMLIWMGKQFLDQRDKPEEGGGADGPLPWSD